jgi:hypothetical protein
MTPSERIKLIKEITKKLTREDWTMVNVSLRQFGIRTAEPDDFYGGLSEYIPLALEGNPDQTLIDIAQHLEINLFESPASIPVPKFWKENYFKLFLSHISSFKKETAELQKIPAFLRHNIIRST